MNSKKGKQKKKTVKFSSGLEECYKMLLDDNSCDDRSDHSFHDKGKEGLTNHPAVIHSKIKRVGVGQTKDVGIQVDLCGCSHKNIKDSISTKSRNLFFDDCGQCNEDEKKSLGYENMKNKESDFGHDDTDIINSTDESLISSSNFKLPAKSKKCADLCISSSSLEEELSFTSENESFPVHKSLTSNRTLKEINKKSIIFNDFKTPQPRHFKKPSCIDKKKDTSLNISSSEEISFTFSDGENDPNTDNKNGQPMTDEVENLILGAFSQVSLSGKYCDIPKEGYASQKSQILMENKKGYSFLKSLDPDVPIHLIHPAAKKYVKNFSLTKVELGQLLYDFFNEMIFSGKLATDATLIWNAKLTKTAGYCRNIKKDKKRMFVIELSVKVCDTPDRVRDTLIHEMCHAFVWAEYGSLEHHGPRWKLWATKCTIILKDLPPITTCHDYSITTKYNYKCSKCGNRFGRHSKLQKFECQRCSGLIQKMSGDKNSDKKTRAQP